MTEETDAKVSVRDLSVRFGAVNVLKGLSLDVRKGEFLVLLGSSGCGKSTLLNAIAGLQEHNEGQVWIGGRNVTWAEPSERALSMVFQSYALYPSMTVRGNLSFGLRMAGAPKDEIARAVEGAAELLPITHLLDRRPHALSGGQRQRVAIGRALVRNSDLFLFDEPLSNLDAKLRAELRVELKTLHQRLGATMIYVTHDQVEALTLADRVAIMKDGVILQLDTPEAVYNRPANRYAASFMGAPPMNLLPGILTRDSGACRFVGHGLQLDVPNECLAGTWHEGQNVELGVRPEHLFLVGPNQHDRVGVLAVHLTELHGSEQIVWAAIGDSRIALRASPEIRVATGQDHAFGLHRHRINL
ncbi:MAG: ABC transporter ATP-binding protein, partial [Tabrizicola sp.]|nr:ABC transporter ATP-binding protein [Tabrizicola sp.]